MNNIQELVSKCERATAALERSRRRRLAASIGLPVAPLVLLSPLSHGHEWGLVPLSIAGTLVVVSLIIDLRNREPKP